MMNSNQFPQPPERVDIRKRISVLWNSRNRIARLTILATAGLVLQCCCLIIPIGNSLAEPSTVDDNAISTPPFATAQDPFIPTALEISVNAEFDNNDGRVVCKNFNSQAATAQVSRRVARIQLDRRDKDGRSCKLLP